MKQFFIHWLYWFIFSVVVSFVVLFLLYLMTRFGTMGFFVAMLILVSFVLACMSTSREQTKKTKTEIT
jgi:hypothetical protein